jgi:hypothetical protein
MEKITWTDHVKSEEVLLVRVAEYPASIENKEG